MSQDALDPGASGPVHLRHSIDGWPLCKPLDFDRPFRGTLDRRAVTCRACIAAADDTRG